jgi:tRNA-(ms[2]io[6]A)-hydroxylase
MSKQLDTELQRLTAFLQTPTPIEWLNYASKNLPLLLIDHAHCERKAAATALNFISKYPEKIKLVHVMSPLAREELLHFEKAITLMEQKNIEFTPLTPSNYASTLHKKATIKNNNQRLCDLLIIGAIIEARSCERFNALIPFLADEQTAKFYASLVKSEARHFEDYLSLAKYYGGSIEQRLDEFLTIENNFITSEDAVFRFHSGMPPN